MSRSISAGLPCLLAGSDASQHHSFLQVQQGQLILLETLSNACMTLLALGHKRFDA